MFISGIGTVNGYIDGRNKEKFSYIDGAVWYDCGDTGYLTEDGSLMICGRNDRQIKRNGKRIELGGIETKLREIEGISNAVVVTENGKELIAFYTAGQKYDTAKLRKQLADMLPDYMLPDDFIFTAAFPLTHNGKINTKALLELYRNTEKSGRDCFLSSEEQLHELVEICENQLQIKGLKPDDNFFKIGGDSLSAIMLITELNSIYECELSLADIFTYPVLGELCDIIHHHERN